MNKRRLLKLADFLETVPRKRFDFTSWVGENWKGDRELSCGTTACALGWATTMPLFRGLGLRLAKSRWGPYVTLGNMRKDKSSMIAAERVFDISYGDAEYLFVPGFSKLGHSATPKMVARQIRQFVKHGGRQE
jgi:hypothetical protein